MIQMTFKRALEMFAWAIGSSACAGVGTGNLWIAASVFFGITALLWPHLTK